MSDVSNAFLLLKIPEGEDIIAKQPKNSNVSEDYVWKLKKVLSVSVYDFPQAPA